eukprot:6187602-Pleurochrysis_carterae.AAC.3
MVEDNNTRARSHRLAHMFYDSREQRARLQLHAAATRAFACRHLTHRPVSNVHEQDLVVLADGGCRAGGVQRHVKCGRRVRHKDKVAWRCADRRRHHGDGVNKMRKQLAVNERKGLTLSMLTPRHCCLVRSDAGRAEGTVVQKREVSR